jgi:hypothetical protein
MSSKLCLTTIATALMFMAVPTVFADDLPPTPPPYHSSPPATAIETLLAKTNVPVSTVRINFGSLGGKETDVVDGAVYNPDETKIYANGIRVKSSNASDAVAVGLEFEIVETISNRFTSSTSVSARYVDPADIPSLIAFVNAMVNVSQTPGKPGANTEMTYQTPGGTIFYYKLNGTHAPDFEITNGPSNYYTYQFNRLVDVAKFRDDVQRAAQWVSQQ